ncbi:hypothetical protein AB1Y20_023457 [Prymnesium parvum]|uniref:Uncharacterized protein n=1 Tax=Prymnesium parvum TaxID=97485 RepID=A0AB34JFH9_PRYPA
MLTLALLKKAVRPSLITTPLFTAVNPWTLSLRQYHNRRRKLHQSKFKIVAKLGENLYKTVKPFMKSFPLHKAKWARFKSAESAQMEAYAAWKRKTR